MVVQNSHKTALRFLEIPITPIISATGCIQTTNTFVKEGRLRAYFLAAKKSHFK